MQITDKRLPHHPPRKRRGAAKGPSAEDLRPEPVGAGHSDAAPGPAGVSDQLLPYTLSVALWRPYHLLANMTYLEKISSLAVSTLVDPKMDNSVFSAKSNPILQLWCPPQPWLPPAPKQSGRWHLCLGPSTCTPSSSTRALTHKEGPAGKARAGAAAPGTPALSRGVASAAVVGPQGWLLLPPKCKQFLKQCWLLRARPQGLQSARL